MISRQPQRRQDVRAEPLPDGSMALYDPRTRMTYAITSSAALVWEACSGTATVSDIARQLSEIYDAPIEVIARDVAALIDDLARLDLLDARSGAPV